MVSTSLRAALATLPAALSFGIDPHAARQGPILHLLERQLVDTNARHRIPALDGVRGLAVLWVVLFHATNSIGHSSPLVRAVLAVTHAGWFGVEIFFTLSGFLITGILLDSRCKPPRDYFGTFYWHRTLRIFPIYFLLLALLVVVPSVIPIAQTEGWRRYLHEQGWFWLYGSNILREYAGTSSPVLEFDWFELTHTWSLAVEEHFYLAWPMLVYLLTGRQLWVTALGLMALSIGLHFIPLDPLASGVLATPKHMTGLCVGACFAMWVRKHPSSLPRFERLVRPLGARWLVFFGTYSYGLYLYHYLLAPLWRRVDLARWPGGYSVGMLCFVALYLGLPLLVAMASFRFIEAPLLRLKYWRRKPRSGGSLTS